MPSRPARRSRRAWRYCLSKPGPRRRTASGTRPAGSAVGARNGSSMVWISRFVPERGSHCSGPRGAARRPWLLCGLLPTAGHLMVAGRTPHSTGPPMCEGSGRTFGQRTQPVGPPGRGRTRTGRLHGIQTRRALEALVDALGVRALLHQRVRELSPGNAHAASWWPRCSTRLRFCCSMSRASAGTSRLGWRCVPLSSLHGDGSDGRSDQPRSGDVRAVLTAYCFDGRMVHDGGMDELVQTLEDGDARDG